MSIHRPIAGVVAACALALALAADSRAQDTTPPIPPTISLAPDDSYWQADRDFRISWMEPPDQETPIASVHYEICVEGPPGCVTRMVTDWEGKGSPGLQRMTVAATSHPIGAEHAVRVWLQDTAGNVNPLLKSNIVTLLFDPWTPELSAFEIRDYPFYEWLNADEAHLHAVQIRYASSPRPASGIAGYSITRDGTVPDESVDAVPLPNSENATATILLEDLAEGLTVLKARAVTGAGLWADPGRFLTEGILRVDKSSPSTGATSTVNLSEWQRDVVAVRVKAVDQAHLSGMDPAVMGWPITDGGYITYSLDGGPPTMVRGDDVDVSIDIDGTHVLTYQAHDAAGNASPERSVTVKIDGSAPTATFEPLRADDPTQLVVNVADATSGVAGGQIEMRREGSATFRSWPARMEDGKLVATLDDDAPDGRYLLRARVRDRAGNEVRADGRKDGQRMAVTLPVRTPTTMQVAKSTRTVDHRARPLIRGRLVTRDGRALRNAVVTVLDRAGAGGRLKPIGSVRTDAKGRFRHRAPARLPSRSIRYSYAGAKTIKPVFRDVPVKVRAGVTLATNRTWLLNGQSVVFSGRLAGPVPKGGKVVALQARKRSGWVTFGTPRANRRGVFKLRYRFTSTTGLQRYRFRAVAVREGAYPYETGASRTVRLTVRGL